MLTAVLSLAVLGAAAAQQQVVYSNTSNVFGRAKLRGDACSIKYLGQQPSQAACDAACTSFNASNATCKSWTWHQNTFPDEAWRGGCYGVTDFSWQMHADNDVVSGRFPSTTRCRSEADCNYNGECGANGTCSCEPQWQGTACDKLNLLPMDKARPLGYRGLNATTGAQVTSWGGSVVYGDDSLYHMYAAEIAGSCGMNVWLSNSRVIHATSADPTNEPFVRQSVVAPVFAHEPIAARAPTGEYVVWYTAVRPPGTLPVNGGHFCSGCKDGNSVASCGTDSNRNASINLPTYMVYSKTAAGPWSTPQEIPGTDVFADSNFAPVINSDGSLVALARGNVYHASSWRNVSSYRVVGRWTDEGEDPFVWIDKRGVYHNIVHVRRLDTVGRHYYSEDGVCWAAALGDAYTNIVQLTDGTKLSYGCRERPHIVQDRHGNIIGLTNGAAEKTCHSDAPPVVDYAYTLLQNVGQKDG